jgi:hypothetical protein
MMHTSIRSIVFGALMLSQPALAAPAVGDTYVYRIVNAYNSEVIGQVTYKVDNINSGQLMLAVSPDRPSLGAPYTEIIASDANWLRRPLINHDVPVDYNFSPPFPAYVAPLDPGKSWSTRVNATNPATGRRNSVRVDASVLGSERITTPAGAFDTIKVKRKVYAGDWEAFVNETNIDETEWFAPALGRAVKTDRKSAYIDQQQCARRGACTPTRGDWFIYELVSYSGK